MGDAIGWALARPIYKDLHGAQPVLPTPVFHDILAAVCLFPLGEARGPPGVPDFPLLWVAVGEQYLSG